MTDAMRTGAVNIEKARTVRAGVAPSSGRRSGPIGSGLSIPGNRCSGPGWVSSQASTSVIATRKMRPTASHRAV